MNKKGLTLIELVIVMAIIAIGAVLIAPNIGGWLPVYRLKGATKDIVSTLRIAQMKAISTNLEYRVSFANQTFLLQKGNLSSGSTNWTAEGATQTLPSGITMSVSLSGGNAEFNPNSTCSTGSLTLTSSKGTKKITLTTSTGRVKVE